MAQSVEGRIIELSFRLLGRTIPVDHGYSLYAAISHIVLEIHDARAIGVQPIRGVYAGNGMLQLTPFSHLILRLPDDQIRSYLKLGGKRLDVDGHMLHVGTPTVRALLPVASLRARLVTIKGYLQEETFLQGVTRQLQSLRIAGETLLGERRTLRVKDKQVVGFEVAVTGLTAEESLSIQEIGLGGRRRMGCGMFVPLGASSR